MIRNREHAEHQHQVGGVSEMKLATVVWDAVKYNLREVEKSLAATIRLAYMQVWRFNLIPSGEIKDLLPDGSHLEDFMRELALGAKIALVMAERKLSAYLSKEVHGHETLGPAGQQLRESRSRGVLVSRCAPGNTSKQDAPSFHVGGVYRGVRCDEGECERW